MFRVFGTAKKLCALALATISLALTAACSHVQPQFTPHPSQAVLQGQGGAIRTTVDGVEIWVEGTPIRKYKVIGTLEFPEHGRNSYVPEDKEWVKEVKLHGGDAMILIHSGENHVDLDNLFTSPTTDFDNANAKPLNAKATIIKYVN